jgi:DNA (cytosine-5)-methyltransferase 1
MDDNGCGGPWLKLARVARGERPRVLDLFSGCGGLSLGLHRAGFEILAGAEVDPHAAASFGRNFRPGSPTHGRPRDITCLTPAGLCDELGLGPVQVAVDVVVGGPPCQSFARIGRAKLRTIREHPQAFLHDPRAGLHERWLAWVRELAPLAVLIENVPDALNVAGRNVAEEIAAELDVLGFLPRYTLLNAALYGVPQMRDRLFLMAIRREFALEPSFPPPSHCYRLPSGYDGSRRVAMRQLDPSGLFRSSYWIAPSEVQGSVGAVTARQALGDLPPITSLRDGTLRRGARRFDQPCGYRPVRQKRDTAAIRRRGHLIP